MSDNDNVPPIGKLTEEFARLLVTKQFETIRVKREILEADAILAAALAALEMLMRKIKGPIKVELSQIGDLVDEAARRVREARPRGEGTVRTGPSVVFDLADGSTAASRRRSHDPRRGLRPASPVARPAARRVVEGIATSETSSARIAPVTVDQAWRPGPDEQPKECKC